MSSFLGKALFTFWPASYNTAPEDTEMFQFLYSFIVSDVWSLLVLRFSFPSDCECCFSGGNQTRADQRFHIFVSWPFELLLFLMRVWPSSRSLLLSKLNWLNRPSRPPILWMSSLPKSLPGHLLPKSVRKYSRSYESLRIGFPWCLTHCMSFDVLVVLVVLIWCSIFENTFVMFMLSAHVLLPIGFVVWFDRWLFFGSKLRQLSAV